MGGMRAEGEVEVGPGAGGMPDSWKGDCVVSILGHECEGMASGIEA